jgi:prepilin-type processing-associated H-X9-DG protein
MEATERRGTAIEPREIKQEGDAGLRITWADDHISRYSAAGLRRACPCAQCVNEWTGQRVLKPETISQELTITDFNIVGRYAVNFLWSDGHATGIYSFRYLRELCEQDNIQGER